MNRGDAAKDCSPERDDSVPEGLLLLAVLLQRKFYPFNGGPTYVVWIIRKVH